jgi:hypothetical protein
LTIKRRKSETNHSVCGNAKERGDEEGSPKERTSCSLPAVAGKKKAITKTLPNAAKAVRKKAKTKFVFEMGAEERARMCMRRAS